MEGRKPIPTRLKVLRGNPGRRPLPAGEPQPRVRLPRPPDELSDRAKREWRVTGRELRALGLMSGIDVAQFAAYCQSYARWLEVTALLKSSPVLLKIEGQVVVNPLLRVARDAQEQFTRALAEFGMSPVSRTRVHAATAQPGDPLTEYLRGS